MSAEKGWIGADPGPQEEWHTPSWSERVGGDRGAHFVTTHESAGRALARKLAEQADASLE